MLFDYQAPTDLDKEEPNANLLADYGSLSQKLPNAINTEKKARPWWTLASGIASSFIPFGLGAFITPTASFLVDKRKQQQTNKLNSYRRQLGLPEKADTSGSGLNLGGVGYSAGSTLSTAMGRDTIPSEGTGVKTLNLSGVGGNAPNFNLPSIQQTPNDESYSRNIDYTTDGNPNAPEITGGGTTGLEGLPNTGYFGNGGGATGLLATTQNGYTIAPSTSMRQGGKIEAPSHEEGGVQLLKDGKLVGIEVEGKERIVNDKDWKDVLSFLKKGKSQTALSLLKSIDKRKPVKGKAGNGLGQSNYIAPKEAQEKFWMLNHGTDGLPQMGGNLTPSDNYSLGDINTNGLTNLFNDSSYTAAPVSEDVAETTFTKTTLPVSGTATAPKFNYDEILRYGFDIGKLGLGLNEATKTLPQYQIPKDWGDHMDKARYFSTQGLLPEEKAEALDISNQAYAQNLRDISNASGGNAGVLLGNLTSLNNNRLRIANQLALADRQAKEASFDKYEGRLLKDIGMKKEIFDREYNQAIANKTEGVGLASDALANISGRMDFNKFYGEGSYYDKLQKALVEKGVSEAEILNMQAEFYKNPANFLAAYTSEAADPKVKEAIKEVDAIEAKKKSNEISKTINSGVAELFKPKTKSK